MRNALFFAARLAVVIIIVLDAAHVLLVIFAGILLAVFLNVLSESLRRIVPVSPGIATIIVIVSLVGLTVAGICHMGMAWEIQPSLESQKNRRFEPSEDPLMPIQ